MRQASLRLDADQGAQAAKLAVWICRFSLRHVTTSIGQLFFRPPRPRHRLSWPAFFAAGWAALLVSACAYNPAIGREQFILVSDAQLDAMSANAWSAVAAETPVSRDAGLRARTDRVTNRLLTAMGESPAAWEVEVFDAPSLNAFALPGGRVGIHAQMVEFTRNDDELAAILGHEIAHVKLRHASERVSQQLAAQSVIDILSPDDPNTAALLGAGATLGVILPFSRRHESEADRLGLDYMHAAGYDPMAAVDLWTRMAAEAGRGSRPVWLSTHPADGQRLAAIRAHARSLIGGGA